MYRRSVLSITWNECLAANRSRFQRDNKVTIRVGWSSVVALPLLEQASMALW